MKRGPTVDAEAPELFSAPARTASIHVPAGGVAEPWLLKQLGLTTAEVHPLHGDEIGAPRDYGYHGNCYFYTAAGVMRLAQIFGRTVDVIDDTAVHQASGPRHHHSKRWDLEERP